MSSPEDRPNLPEVTPITQPSTPTTARGNRPMFTPSMRETRRGESRQVTHLRPEIQADREDLGAPAQAPPEPPTSSTSAPGRFEPPLPAQSKPAPGRFEPPLPKSSMPAPGRGVSIEGRWSRGDDMTEGMAGEGRG